MKSNKQYLIVGTFVLLGFALIIGIWLWFSASNRKVYDTYRITFHEPVDGITTNSVVKYNGVEVGKVKAINLDEQDPSSIFVDISVNQGLPIATTTFATIKPQGITGMSFINLGLNKIAKYSIIKPHNSLPYPSIPAKTSLLYSLTEQAQSVTGNVKDISIQIKTLLNDNNLQHINNMVANMDKVTAALAKQSDNIGHTVELVVDVLNHVNENAKNMNEAVVQIGNLSKSLQQNSVAINKVLDGFQNNTMRNVNTVLLPNLNQTVTNLSRTTSQIDELMHTINQNPSVLVRGKTPAVAGPGE